MRCWIGFDGRTTTYSFVFFVLMTLFGILGVVHYEFKQRYIAFSVLVFVFILYRSHFSFNLFGLIGHSVTALNVLWILSIPDSDKKDLLTYIVKWFGLLMLASLIVYVLTFFVSLPSLGIIQTDYGNESVSGYDAINYLVYIKPILTPFNIDVVRFNGPFIEPGDIGCVASFILMATQFKFKQYKYLWAILVANLVSLSLAGYVLTIVGFLFSLINRKHMSLFKKFIILLLLGGLFFTVRNSAGSDNIFYANIFSRLEFDNEKVITGNNRSSSTMDMYYEKMLHDPSTFYWGYSSETVAMIKEDSPGAGFVSLMLSVGLIGFLLVCSPYFIFAITSKTKTYSILFFILFLLFMSQRSEAFWTAYILSYVFGIVINERENNYAGQIMPPNA